jgi:hypothetical protein
LQESQKTWFSEYKEQQVRLAQQKFAELVGAESIQNEIKSSYTIYWQILSRSEEIALLQEEINAESERAAVLFAELFPEIQNKDVKPYHTVQFIDNYDEILYEKIQDTMTEQEEIASQLMSKIYPQLRYNFVD